MACRLTVTQLLSHLILFDRRRFAQPSPGSPGSLATISSNPAAKRKENLVVLSSSRYRRRDFPRTSRRLSRLSFARFVPVASPLMRTSSPKDGKPIHWSGTKVIAPSNRITNPSCLQRMAKSYFRSTEYRHCCSVPSSGSCTKLGLISMTYLSIQASARSPIGIIRSFFPLPTTTQA